MSMLNACASYAEIVFALVQVTFSPSHGVHNRITETVNIYIIYIAKSEWDLAQECHRAKIEC